MGIGKKKHRTMLEAALENRYKLLETILSDLQAVVQSLDILLDFQCTASAINLTDHQRTLVWYAGQGLREAIGQIEALMRNLQEKEVEGKNE